MNDAVASLLREFDLRQPARNDGVARAERANGLGVP
jgi:hypothetical protein